MSVSIIDCQCSHRNCETVGVYHVEARCSNCGWEGVARCTKGHEKPSRARLRKCPRCGCQEVTGGDYVEVETANPERLQGGEG